MLAISPMLRLQTTVVDCFRGFSSVIVVSSKEHLAWHIVWIQICAVLGCKGTTKTCASDGQEYVHNQYHMQASVVQCTAECANHQGYLSPRRHLEGYDPLDLGVGVVKLHCRRPLSCEELLK